MQKDLFSAQAATYRSFRPTYPPELFKYLVSQVSGRDLAWDCGTGNGQAASGLAPYFTRVIATDGSAKQLSQAPKLANVEYRVAVAEDPGLADQSADLITVAQALHWFELDKFYPEVKRILKPGGLFAVWCYGSCKSGPEVDRIEQAFYANTLAGYWDPARQLIDEGYQTIPFPFREIEAPSFELEVVWDLTQFAGYLESWSAVQAYIKKNGHSPVPEVQKQLEKVWGTKRKVSWPIKLRVGSKVG